MTPLDIIGVVKHFQEKNEPFFITPAEFAPIAEALLIAYGVLKHHEHLVRGECIEGCDMCNALKQIRSLSHSL